MPKRTPFPGTLYVTREAPPNDQPYLVARDEADLQNLDETQPCAVYKLVRVGRVNVTRTLE
jgi:hypothetical protein